MERWYLTAHLKTNVATQILKYSGLDLTPDKIHIHKEATENRIRQDEDVATNIIEVTEESMTIPFCVSSDWTADESQPLLSISTGMVATDEISSWIKQICADGTKQLTEFVEQGIQLQNKEFF